MALRSLLCTASDFLRSSVCFSSPTGDQVMINQTCPRQKNNPKAQEKKHHTDVWYPKHVTEPLAKEKEPGQFSRGSSPFQLLTWSGGDYIQTQPESLFQPDLHFSCLDQPKEQEPHRHLAAPGLSQRALAQPHPRALLSEPELKLCPKQGTLCSQSHAFKHKHTNKGCCPHFCAHSQRFTCHC